MCSSYPPQQQLVHESFGNRWLRLTRAPELFTFRTLAGCLDVCGIIYGTSSNGPVTRNKWEPICRRALINQLRSLFCVVELSRIEALVVEFHAWFPRCCLRTKGVLLLRTIKVRIMPTRDCEMSRKLQESRALADWMG